MDQNPSVQLKHVLTELRDFQHVTKDNWLEEPETLPVYELTFETHEPDMESGLRTFKKYAVVVGSVNNVMLVANAFIHSLSQEGEDIALIGFSKIDSLSYFGPRSVNKLKEKMAITITKMIASNT